MTIKTLLYTFVLACLLTSLCISANQPLYINGKEIPIHLAAIARKLLNVSTGTITIQLKPSKLDELMIILTQYEQLLNQSGKIIAFDKNLLIELQKKKIFS